MACDTQQTLKAKKWRGTLKVSRLIFLLILEFQRRADKITEERVRVIRARFQFGMKLTADKPRVKIFIQLELRALKLRDSFCATTWNR